MTVEDFRKAPQLVDWLRALQRTQNWEMMLHAMEGSHPRKESNPNMTETECVKKLGFIEGFDRALDLIVLMGKPPTTTDGIIESTFGTEDEEKKD